MTLTLRFLSCLLFCFALGSTSSIAADPPNLPGTLWVGMHKEKVSARGLGSLRYMLGIEVRFLANNLVRVDDVEGDVYTGSYRQEGKKIFVSFDAPTLQRLADEIESNVLAEIGVPVEVTILTMEIVAKAKTNRRGGKMSYKMKGDLEFRSPGGRSVSGKFQAKGKTELQGT